MTAGTVGAGMTRRSVSGTDTDSLFRSSTSSAFHYKDYKSCESEIELVPAERDWGFVELGNALEDALFKFRL